KCPRHIRARQWLRLSKSVRSRSKFPRHLFSLVALAAGRRREISPPRSRNALRDDGVGRSIYLWRTYAETGGNHLARSKGSEMVVPPHHVGRRNCISLRDNREP